MSHRVGTNDILSEHSSWSVIPALIKGRRAQAARSSNSRGGPHVRRVTRVSPEWELFCSRDVIAMATGVHWRHNMFDWRCVPSGSCGF